jgi:peptidoglycan/LPS O-acetylase OafA/YrhL
VITERSLYIHFVRAISALLVCTGHAKEFILMDRQPSDGTLSLMFRGLLSLGGPAVMVFFFISGFLVGGREIINFRHGNLNPRKYLLDRLSRLWLVIIPALILTYFLNSITCTAYRYDSFCQLNGDLNFYIIPPDRSEGIFDFLRNLLFLQSFLGPVWGSNGPLWSLSYEFWYYIIFYSILILLFAYKTRAYLSKRIAFAILSLVVGFFVLNTDWLKLGIVWLFGALASGFPPKWTLLRFLDAGGVFTKIVLIFSGLVLPAMLISKIHSNFLTLLLISGVLYFSIFCMKSDNLVSSHKFKKTVLFSSISFTLYALHFPLIALISAAIGLNQDLPMNVPNLLLVVLVSTICVLFSLLIASFTELKLEKVRNYLGYKFI